ncbi:MAG: MerR family transcriptional regulator [Lachnospiraceae bacterium]
MEYTIGEVSELLGVSRDMIRYYEKQGAIKASRNTANNYRYYDDMEFFWLLEAMEHKSWGIPINEISDIRNNKYSYNTEQFLGEEALRLREESAYKQVLARRLEEIRRYMLLGIQNIGNFWVDHLNAEYRCHLVRGRGDVYDRISLTPDATRFIFADKALPFFDSGLTVGEDYVDWEMTIAEKYLDVIAGSLPDSFYKVPEGLYLCTNVDIGEIGEFDMSVFDVLREYADAHGYQAAQDGRMRGILLGRGNEEGRFRRIVKIGMPVIRK